MASVKEHYDKLLAAYSQLKLKHNQLLKERNNDLAKLEKRVKVKFVKDELENWLRQIRKNP